MLLVKASAFDVKLIGPFLRVLGQLPVRRGETDAALVLQEAERALAAGECVVIYPERTARPGRVADDGPDRRGPAGAGHWCRGDPGRLVGGPADAPLRQHPAAPGAAQDRAYAGRSAGRPERVRGKPLTRDVVRAATNTIMAKLTALLGELPGEQPPAVPYDPAAAHRAARGHAAEDVQSVPAAEAAED